MPARKFTPFLNLHYTVLTQKVLYKAGVLLGPYGNRDQAIGLLVVIQPMIISVRCKRENREMAIEKEDGFAK